MTAPLSIRLAWRELRAGAKGFRVFFACLALGVGAIAAAGSVAKAFSDGLASQTREILGGDVELILSGRLAPDADRAVMADYGDVAAVIETRAMAEGPEVRKLVEIRALGRAYPLVGEMTLDPPVALDQAMERRNGVFGAAVAPEMLDQFRMALGDRLQVGEGALELRTVVVEQPDRIAAGFTLGPRVFVSMEGLEALGLLKPGALFRASYRVAAENPSMAKAALLERLAPEGYEVRGSADAVEGLNELIGQVSVFLAVVGLAALVAGGIGVMQAVDAYIEAKTTTIAALKALGANSGLIRASYASQAAALAVLGGMIGVGLGAAAPLLVWLALGDRLPIDLRLGVYPGVLATALLQGVFAAAAFAAPAIGRARATSPNALFRGAASTPRRPPALETALGFGAGAAFAALAIGTSPAPVMTAGLLGGALAAFALLYATALGTKWLAKTAAQRASGLARLSLINLGGPQSLAPIAGPALGLGVVLVATVMITERSLITQIRDIAPESAPSMFFSEIAARDAEDFDALMDGLLDGADADVYRRTPVLTGRITGLKGAPLDREAVAGSERWIVDGEIGMTFLGPKPEESPIEAGSWWPIDYAGPPLVSIEGDAARGMGLEIGDRVGFTILGRDVEATLANMRTIDWGGFGINFAIVFAPGTLEAANPRHAAILKIPEEEERRIARAVGEAFPEVGIVHVREVFAAAVAIFDDIALAVRAAASIVAVSGALVLAGAFAAAARRRRAATALLTALGMSRREALGVFMAEFAMAGAAAAAIAVGLAVAAAYPLVVNVFEATWRLDSWLILGVVGATAAASAFGGWLAGRTALAAPPARILREG